MSERPRMLKIGIVLLLLLCAGVGTASAAEDTVWNGPQNIFHIQSGGGETIITSMDKKIAILYIPPTDANIDQVQLLPMYPHSDTTNWNVSIQGDSGGLPDGNAISWGNMTCPLEDEVWKDTNIIPSAPVTKGTHYWIVIKYLSGTEPSGDVYPKFYANVPGWAYPGTNYWLPLNQTGTDITQNDNMSYTAAKIYNGESWIDAGRQVYTFMVRNEDGSYAGSPLKHNSIEVGPYGLDTYEYGQVINVSSNATINTISSPWCILWNDGYRYATITDDLYYVLYEGEPTSSLGDVLAQGTFIAATEVNRTSTYSGADDRQWYTTSLPANISLVEGQNYFLKFKSPNNSMTQGYGSDVASSFWPASDLPRAYNNINYTYGGIDSWYMSSKNAGSTWQSIYKYGDFSFRLGYDPTPLPVANFSQNTTEGENSLTVGFTDESVYNATSWFWDFGDGDNSTDQNPTHTFDAGTFNVSLMATGTGGSDNYTVYSAVFVDSIDPPTANFTATPTSGSAPLTVEFTDTSTGTPTSWLWDFGDGETSTEQNPLHEFPSTGSYTVTLTATNAAGSDSISYTVTLTATTETTTTDNIKTLIISGIVLFSLMILFIAGKAIQGEGFDYDTLSSIGNIATFCIMLLIVVSAIFSCI